MSWALRRQIIIFSIVTGFFVLTALILWLVYKPRPSCNDDLQNQNELGVDCGGICVAVCPSEVSAPIVLWQQPLSLGGNKYGLAALVENKNDRFGIGHLGYTFKVFSAGHVLLTTVTGSTFINPNEKTVIYVPNVVLSENAPTRVVLDLATTTWQRQNTPVSMELVVSEGSFVNSAPNPEVRAVVRNDSLEVYRDIMVQVVLSDAERNVFAASQTLIDELKPNEAKNISLTWPEPFAMVSSSEPIIDFYARFNTLKPKAFE